MQLESPAAPTVVVVDDNPIDRTLAVTAFRRAGIANPIQEIGDGEELLEYLLREGRHAELPPPLEAMVILLDINMPRKGGLEALAEIKRHPQLRHIPVVMLTTSDAESDVTQAYALGANSFITKPLGFVDFMKLVRQFAAYWLDAVVLPAAPLAQSEAAFPRAGSAR